MNTKRIAFIIAVGDYIRGEGYRVGIAIEGEKGYSVTDWRWAGNGNFNEAQAIADKRNLLLFGGNMADVWKVIDSTM